VHLVKLFGTAASLLIVILAQSAATSRAYAQKHGEPFEENVDLVGLSFANVAAAFSGAFVVNGSPTKTAMVENARGRSQLAQLTTSAIVLLVLLFLTRPLAFMPNAVLATVVFLIGVDLVDIRGMARILHVRRDEFAIAVITAATVVLVGVEAGILLAMALSLFLHLSHAYRPCDRLLVPGSRGHWDPKALKTGAEAAPGVRVYRFGASLYYANSAQFTGEALSVAAYPKAAAAVVIAASAIEDIDYTGYEAIVELHHRLAVEGVRLAFAEVEENVRAELDHYGLTKLLGPENLFESVSDAVDALSAGSAWGHHPLPDPAA
jgi:MFS superfamily sulfate permease-like transporter